MQRYRLKTDDEWYAALYLADKYNLFKDTLTPLYIRGTTDRWWGVNGISHVVQTVHLHFDEGIHVSTNGLYWHGDIDDGMWTEPYGNPLEEMLRGTFGAAVGTAHRISHQSNDWIYTLVKLPGVRQIKFGLRSDVKLTHAHAMRVAGR